MKKFLFLVKSNKVQIATNDKNKSAKNLEKKIIIGVKMKRYKKKFFNFLSEKSEVSVFIKLVLSNFFICSIFR